MIKIDDMKNNKIICVVGPTASGKTGLGVRIAKKFNGEIISADSRQVYKGLDIGTGKEGKPAKSVGMTKSELQVDCHSGLDPEFTNLDSRLRGNDKSDSIEQLRDSLRYIDDIPQWLIDVCDPGEEFNLFDWLELAKKAIEDIQKRGKVPIIIGGTGLYVQALTEGFELEKNQNDNSKCKIYSRIELEEKTVKELQEIVYKLEANTSKLDFNNPHRLIRAIEKNQSGKRASKSKPKYDFLQIGINWPREELNKRIDRRTEEWFDEGFFEEILGLLDNGVDPEWLRKIGLDYKIVTEYIIQMTKSESQMSKKMSNEEISKYRGAEFEKMLEELKTKIHQYAKRQMTWFKRFSEIKWADKADVDKAEILVNEFIKPSN